MHELRIGLDLDGSLESLGNSMTDLANSLEATGTCELVRFRSQSKSQSPSERSLRLKQLWRPLWRRSLGPRLDAQLNDVDIVHLAGILTPPTKSVPLVISVDDMRPFRTEEKTHLRIRQLQRAVANGAVLAASSRTASHEVLSVLGLERHQVLVVPPAVPLVKPTITGSDLVVNVTGRAERFLQLAPELIRFASVHDAQVVAVTSADVRQQIKAAGLFVTVRPRSAAAQSLANARVALHISDGARFPSFAIAALSAGVPTVTRNTEINRELLSGASLLLGDEDDPIGALSAIWDNEAQRAILVAAGHSRAQDFSPNTAAQAYLGVYHDVVKGWR